MWVLSSVFSIFCITSFRDCTHGATTRNFIFVTYGYTSNKPLLLLLLLLLLLRHLVIANRGATLVAGRDNDVQMCYPMHTLTIAATVKI